MPRATKSWQTTCTETVQYTNILACQVGQNIAYKYTVTTTLTDTSQEKLSEDECSNSMSGNENCRIR